MAEFRVENDVRIPATNKSRPSDRQQHWMPPFNTRFWRGPQCKDRSWVGCRYLGRSRRRPLSLGDARTVNLHQNSIIHSGHFHPRRPETFGYSIVRAGCGLDRGVGGTPTIPKDIRRVRFRTKPGGMARIYIKRQDSVVVFGDW